MRTSHGTATALTKVINDSRINNDSLKVLVFLDLTAALNTVDHEILIHRLQDKVGLTGQALDWFSSYLKGRSLMFQLAVLDQSEVPQESILGPLLFNFYMLPLGAVLKNHNKAYNCYADDTRLYLSLSSDDLMSVRKKLMSYVDDINCWMSQSFLERNRAQTKTLFVGPKSLGHKNSFSETE